MSAQCSFRLTGRRVYNVEEFHYEDFVAAIETAMETPMEP